MNLYIRIAFQTGCCNCSLWKSLTILPFSSSRTIPLPIVQAQETFMAFLSRFLPPSPLPPQSHPHHCQELTTTRESPASLFPSTVQTLHSDATEGHVCTAARPALGQKTGRAYSEWRLQRCPVLSSPKRPRTTATAFLKLMLPAGDRQNAISADDHPCHTQCFHLCTRCHTPEQGLAFAA